MAPPVYNEILEYDDGELSTGTNEGRLSCDALSEHLAKRILSVWLNAKVNVRRRSLINITSPISWLQSLFFNIK